MFNLETETRPELTSRLFNRAVIVADLALRKFGNGVISFLATGENSMSDGPYDELHDRAKVDNMNSLDELEDRIKRADRMSLAVGWKAGSYREYRRVREGLLE